MNERERFEAWCIPKHGWACESRWEGWQAAKAEAAERERELMEFWGNELTEEQAAHTETFGKMESLVAEVERLRDENEGLIGAIALGIEALVKHRRYALANRERKEASDA